MKKTISEIAKLSGVSVRTLHYYDEIGLLKPSEISGRTGYRYYDEVALETLQQILFYRELEFPLKEIIAILQSPGYDKEKAMQRQTELLKLKRNRLNRLIDLLERTAETPKGETTMSFEEFDTREIDEARAKYAAEAKVRWGTTQAYAQNQKKTGAYNKEDWNRVNAGMDALLQAFAKQLGQPPESEAVQKLVERWQQFITENYYTCTKEILAGLGQMYVADERFTKNMDKHGTGTAELISKAIAFYSKK